MYQQRERKRKRKKGGGKALIGQSDQQHIPKSIRNANSILKRSLPSRACKSSTPNPTQTCDSAIGLHLLLNASCAKHYHQDRFRILARGRSAFHLSVLESIFIKTSNPDLCRQKEFVYSLKIYR